MLRERGLYVHFPWCVKKCPYCDFNSHPVNTGSSQKDYFSAVSEDLAAQMDEYNPGKFTSVFFGGGTPSLAEPKYIEQILREVCVSNACEITLELNPGTNESTSINELSDAGINRLSIGAQSFNSSHLKKLGRIHDTEEIYLAFAEARKAGIKNINIDLMWGLPGQTTNEAIEDLLQAIALRPEHISWYQLTIEPKTEFHRRPPTLPIENILTNIEKSGLSLLADNDFIRYEISAFGQTNFKCAHNLNYWSFGDYLGVGAGAHGKITESEKIIRTEKPKQPRLYQKGPTYVASKEVSKADLQLEFLMNTLRLIEGVDWSLLRERTGLLYDEIKESWANLSELGLVSPDKCATTDFGLKNLDFILQKFCK